MAKQMRNSRNEAWANAGNNITRAKAHYEYCKENFSDDTESSIAEIVEYGSRYPEFVFEDKKYEPRISDTEITLWSTDSLDAARKIIKKSRKKTKTAILDFASYTSPGGKYMEGSYAQEEFLCHNSNLFNILHEYARRTDWYRKNRINNAYNNGLYGNNILYVPDVVFEPDKFDVIVAAAPNKRIALENGIHSDEVLREMYKRIHTIFACAADMGVDNIVLGAFGCGVFCNDSFDVFVLMMHVLETRFSNVFTNVVMAVPDSIYNNNNKNMFRAMATMFNCCCDMNKMSIKADLDDCAHLIKVFCNK